MGNCGSNPKTKEGPVPEEVKVEQKESATNVETNTEDSENKSLATLLNEKIEEAPKTEIEKADSKAEEAKAEAKPEEPKAEEVKEVKVQDQEENPQAPNVAS